MGQRTIPIGGTTPKWIVVTCTWGAGLLPATSAVLVLVDRFLSTKQVSPLGATAFFLALAALVVSGINAFRAAKSKEKEHDACEIASALNAGHAAFCERFGLNKDELRCAIHAASKNGRQFRQVTGYSLGRGEGAGRITPIACGIVGKAFRTCEAQVAARGGQSLDDYRKELIEKWGYSKEQANKINEFSRSFLAIPLPRSDGSGNPLAQLVLYCDTPRTSFFDQEKLKAAATILIGITAHFEYSSEKLQKVIDQFDQSSNDDLPNTDKTESNTAEGSGDVAEIKNSTSKKKKVQPDSATGRVGGAQKARKRNT